MRYAIVSDIHANRPAWQAVLDDIAREGVDTICCLGDIVGYGPRPRAVLDSVLEHCENVVMGNHDAVIAGALSSDTFNFAAREAIEWTRERLGPEWREVFARLPLTLYGDGMMLTHAEPSDPGKFRYITKPEQARAALKAAKREVVFFGHTHESGVFTCGKSGKTVNKLPAADLVLEQGRRYLINPGSVGDPRCRSDLRASYCLYDSKTREVRFRRVEFDVEAYRRDFEASGLRHKPYFLRVIDEESIREGQAGPVVEDHRGSIEVAAIAPDRRIHFGGAPLAPAVPAPPQYRLQVAASAHREAIRARRQSKRGLLATAAAVLLAGIGIGCLLPLGEGSTEAVAEPEGGGERKGERREAGAAPAGTRFVSAPNGNPVRRGGDLQRIMAEDGWEDPSE